VATLISRRGSENSIEDDNIEDQSSLRILRWVAKALIDRVEDFKPQEISNSIWALATLGFGAATSTTSFNTNNDYISLPSKQPDVDKKLVSEALLAVTKNANTRLQRFKPQELNNLAWGLCRLGQYSDEMMQLYEGIGREIKRRHRYFAPQVCKFAMISFFPSISFSNSIFVKYTHIIGYWYYIMEFCNSRIF
jgi:hypothetical protein